MFYPKFSKHEASFPSSILKKSWPIEEMMTTGLKDNGLLFNKFELRSIDIPYCNVQSELSLSLIVSLSFITK